MLKLLLVPIVALAAASPPLVAMAGAAESPCAECHEDAVTTFSGNVHARVRSFETPDGIVGCASCHGNTTGHLETGETDQLRTLGKGGDKDVAACLSCHAARGIGEWAASMHATEMACTECHTIHGAKAPDRGCVLCHTDVSAKMRAPSHHPVPEGKMSCASCHDVHRGNEGALRTSERTNDLCLTCHAAQQGPFIFQHDPVEEDCLICHSPHGSPANNLLLANEPFLCLQCHELHFHAGFKSIEEQGDTVVGGKTYPNVMGAHGYQKSFGTKCTQCHTRIHGSDLPSNSVPGQGSGLVR